MITAAQQLLDQAVAILPLTADDLIYKGVAAGVSERILEFKKSSVQLHAQHGSIENLERKLQAQGVTADDHSLYTDLLEWRAVNHELAELLHLLESL